MAAQVQGTREFMAMREKLVELLGAARDGKLDEFKRKCGECTAFDGVDSAVDALHTFKDGRGRTAMHFAALAHQREVCEHIHLLDSTAWNWVDDDGATPFLLALGSEAEQQLVELMIASGANVKAANNKGVTALHHAATADSVELVRALVEAGAEVNAVSEAGTPLHFAAGAGAERAAVALVEAGADVNAQGRDGSTALLQAAARGSTSGARLLVEAGADVHLTTDEAHDLLTPLHVAAEGGHTPLLCVLLAANGAAEARRQASGMGYTPLQCAAAQGSEEAVRLLLEGVDVTASDVGLAGDDEAALAEARGGGVDVVAARVIAAQQQRWTVDEARLREEAAERKRREESGEPAPLETREAVGDEARARAEALKGEGNALVEEKRWAEAEAKYTEALGQDGANAALYSNRSMARLRQGKKAEALQDAVTARKLRPEWHKAHFRVGCAQRDAGRHEASAQAFWEAVQKDNTNEQYMKAFNAAIKRARVAAGRQ